MKLPVLTHPEQNDSILKNIGVSLAAHLDRSRKNKGGKYAVRIRIIHKRIIKYYGTKINLTVKEYEQIVIGKHRSKLKEQSIIIVNIQDKEPFLFTRSIPAKIEKFS